ncbi:sickle [Haematobia irritans]|uniref:sickle n=1 Tax=Haematobia irritans TaxID=7368 RepID=UPI003F4F854F
MAIPFCEPAEEQTVYYQQQQQPMDQNVAVSEEVDQVDGHVMSSPLPNHIETPPNSPPPPPPTSEANVMAWKLLAMAMCKALKDHYQQTLASSGNGGSNTSSSTAVIEILPNGQMKPSWN